MQNIPGWRPIIARRKVLAVHSENCVGCLACVVACKQEHGLGKGPAYITVSTRGPQLVDGHLRLQYVVNHCLHCGHPACKDACPLGAITIGDDGIVLVNRDLCNGCGACVDACSFDAVRLGEDGVAEKCNLCADGRAKGGRPACVAACPAHCIYFGEVGDVINELGGERAAWLRGIVG